MVRSSAYVRSPLSPWKNIEKSSWRFGSTTTRTESPELDFAVTKLARPAANRRILLRENISYERDEQPSTSSHRVHRAQPLSLLGNTLPIGISVGNYRAHPGPPTQTPTAEAVPVFVQQSSSGAPSSRPPLFSLLPLLFSSISLWALQRS